MVTRRQFLAGAAGLLLPVERRVERAYSFVGGWAPELAPTVTRSGRNVVVLHETTDWLDDGRYYAGPSIHLTQAGAELFYRLFPDAATSL